MHENNDWYKLSHIYVFLFEKNEHVFQSCPESPNELKDKEKDRCQSISSAMPP